MIHYWTGILYIHENITLYITGTVYYTVVDMAQKEDI
jgi:hypothetical protein